MIKEWQASGNGKAVVLCDRPITWGGDLKTVDGTASVWDQAEIKDEKVWKGQVVFNEGRVEFRGDPRMEGISYGQSKFIEDHEHDYLFTWSSWKYGYIDLQHDTTLTNAGPRNPTR